MLFPKGKGKVSEWVDNGGEEEASPLFPRVRHLPEVPRRVNGFPVIRPWFRDWFLFSQQWPELMAFLASVSMIGILNMASCHLNFPLLEALAERFSYQTNTFFLPMGETTPTLEEVVRVSTLSLAGIAYQPSIATNDHSIMGARLLGAVYSSYGQVTPLFSTVLASIDRGLHDRVTRGDRFIEGSVLILPYFCHRKPLEKAWTEPRWSKLGDTGGVAPIGWGVFGFYFLQIWAYEHSATFRPPRSTTNISATLGLAYVNDTPRLRDVKYYRRVLDELSSFDWVIRGLDNVPLFLTAMGHSCLILVGQYFTEGYFPQIVFLQFRHTQHYTSSGEAIDCRPIFPLQRHSSTLLVKGTLSWKGKKSSSSEGLLKQDKPTTTSSYDSWWGTCLSSSTMPQIPETLWGTFCSCLGFDAFSRRQCLFLR
ncbi:hypothetical protein AMTRI_Chr12g270590 [Amborella trichopoda]